MRDLADDPMPAPHPEGCACAGCACPDTGSDQAQGAHAGHSHAWMGLQAGGGYFENFGAAIIDTETGLAAGVKFQSLGMMSNSTSSYNITLNYTGPSAYLDEFNTAIAIWEAIITTDIPDTMASGVFVDDLRIDATIEAIDGAGGILGRAGPTNLRGGSLLPSRGIMEFDVADIANLDAQGILQNVITHEIGHVLGIGTLWNSLNLTGTGAAQFQYTGTHARDEYRDLTGANDAFVPVEQDGGAGTAGGHWDEGLFDAEMMTGFVEGAGTAMPISRMTIGALEDLGYGVDYGEADPYALPGAPVQDDFSGNTGTTGVVSVNGGSVTGDIQYGSDADWFAVTLAAGTTYEITLSGAGTNAGTLADPVIDGIYDANGNAIPGTSDDDGAGNLNARVIFTPATSGTYYIAASAFNEATGTYTLAVVSQGVPVDPIGVYTANGVLIDTVATLAEAMQLVPQGGAINVSDAYTAGPETVTVSVTGLSLGLAAGIAKPTLNLAPGVASIILSGEGDADVIDLGTDGTSEIVIGNGGENRLDGWLGDDILVGSAGDDILIGHTGQDVLVGDAGNDQLFGGGGDDNMSGGAGNDTISGGANTDFISGGAGNDSIDGDGGDDVIEGGTGADVLDGGAGMDWLAYTASSSGVFINLGGTQTATGNTAQSDATGDQISGFEAVNASDHGDTIFGNEVVNIFIGNGGNDQLWGEQGDDIITGGAGDDTVGGGDGADILFGDAGADTFVMELGDTLDIIVDFTQGTDILRILSPAADSIAALEITDDQGNLRVEYGADTVLLLGLAGATLTQADFDFA